MKTRLTQYVVAMLLCVAFAAILHAESSAFTFQGRLLEDGAPASGTYDMTFTLYDSSNNQGTTVAGPSTNSPVTVTNGLFTTTLDFGAGVFDGNDRWLEIGVATNGSGVFTSLSPRQHITSTPYAMAAERLLGGFTVVKNTNDAPNVIGGSSINYVSNSVVGATISGGGTEDYYGRSYTNVVAAYYGTVGGGLGNTASGLSATVAGGWDNIASGLSSTVAGGAVNLASWYWTTVGGGANNVASAMDATVAGGYYNTASGVEATVGGGYTNTASGEGATVPGGYGNIASGQYSFAAGYNAQAIYPGSFVWSDYGYGFGGPFTSTAYDQFSVRARGGVRLVGDVQIGDGSGDYRHLQIGGGNSSGFLYGSYPKFGDGIHLGYNYYANSIGTDVIVNTGGGTSRISVGYGFISLATGGINTPPTDRLVIDISGRVGIGRQPTANRLEVEGNASKSTSGSWLANSDARIKTDIATVTNALATLERVRLVSFHYSDAYRVAHPGIDDHTYFNVVAQEFQKVFPDYVKSSGEKLSDGSQILQVDSYPLTIYSAAAIQELHQKLEQERAENAELKQEIGEIKRIVNQLSRKLDEGLQ